MAREIVALLKPDRFEASPRVRNMGLPSVPKNVRNPRERIREGLFWAKLPGAASGIARASRIPINAFRTVDYANGAASRARHRGHRSADIKLLPAIP